MRLKKANCTVTTHSHSLDLNSAQPAVMSCHRLPRPGVAVPVLAVPGVPPGIVSKLSASTLAA